MVASIGILIAFIGTFITFADIIFSKPKTGGATWNDLNDMNRKEYKSRKFTLIGLAFIALGTFLQIISLFIN